MVLLICFVVLHFLYHPPVTAVINNCQPPVYTFTLSFIPDWCYVISPNTYITFPLTQCTIHEYKTGNNVSEFTHPNCITLSYYSSPNTRVRFLNIWYTSVHSNLEHGLVILTESFSPLRSVLHNLPCLSPKQKWCDKPRFSCFVMCTTTRSIQFELVPISLNCRAKCAKCPVENSIVVLTLS